MSCPESKQKPDSASIVQVQAWMGHADIKTTMRYLHHKSPADNARLLSAAFEPSPRDDEETAEAA
jgi:integrase